MTLSSGGSPDEGRGEDARRLELILVRKVRPRVPPHARADPGHARVRVVQRAERVDAAAERGDVETVLAGREPAEVQLERREGDLAGGRTVEIDREQGVLELRAIDLNIPAVRVAEQRTMIRDVPAVKRQPLVRP